MGKKGCNPRFEVWLEIMLTRMAWIVAALVLGSGERVWAHESAGAARYLGNEGVLVTLGEVKVLFDAFYADSYGSYVLVSESDREKLMNDKPPFDGIDAIFVRGRDQSPGR